MSQDIQRPQKELKRQALTMEEIDFLNRAAEKYDELMRSPSMLDSEKQKWKATFEEFDDFYNSAPCGYCTIDGTGLILKINQTQLNWLGHTSEEVVNKMTLLELLSEGSTMLFYRYMPVLREVGNVDQLEVAFQRRSGKPLQALVSAHALYDDKGNFTCARVTAWDITDRKKMEDEMMRVNRHLRAMNERFEEKNTLVQKLTDELKQLKREQRELTKAMTSGLERPLSRMLAICQKVISTQHMPEADVEKYLRQAEEVAGRMCGFVANLHRQQRINYQDSVQLSRFNLSKLMVTVVNRLEDEAQDKNLLINCDIYETVWVQSDKDYMMQVLDTLLTTGIKLSTPGKEVPLRLIRKVNEYLVELEIHGLVIGPDEFAALFEGKRSAGGHNPPEVLVYSQLISALTENLGCCLTVHPLESSGTLIRLSIPQK